MIVLLYVLLAIAAIVIGLNVAGLATSRHHTASVRAVIPASIEEVWNVISNLGEQHWRPSVRQVRSLADREGKDVWAEKIGRWEFPLVTERCEPPTLLMRRFDEPGAPFRGSWTYALEPAESGTRVTITERGEIQAPAFRVLARLGGLSKTARTYLLELGKRFGVEVEVEPVAADQDPRA